MPGFDRWQERLISAVELNTQLQQFALVPQDIMQKQVELLASMVEKFRKSPSIFQGGRLTDYTNSYPLPKGGNASSYYTALGVETVAILPILDADIVRISIQGAVESDAPTIMAFALSTSDASNPIPVESFSLTTKNSYFFDDGSLSRFLFQGYSISEEIPCSGYKYLHFFGLVGGTIDLFSQLPAIGSSYCLIK
jgi:hypothetical protein